MHVVQHWKWPSCGYANAPRLEIGRWKRGRAFPVVGLAGLGGLRPAACRDSMVMAGDEHGNGFLVDEKTALIWRLGDGKWQGVSGCGGRRIAPSPVAQFCNDAHGAALEMAALWTGQRPSIGDWATEN